MSSKVSFCFKMTPLALGRKKMFLSKDGIWGARHLSLFLMFPHIMVSSQRPQASFYLHVPLGHIGKFRFPAYHLLAMRTKSHQNCFLTVFTIILLKPLNTFLLHCWKWIFLEFILKAYSQCLSLAALSSDISCLAWPFSLSYSMLT